MILNCCFSGAAENEMKAVPVIFQLKCPVQHYDWGMKGKGTVLQFYLRQHCSEAIASNKAFAEVIPLLCLILCFSCGWELIAMDLHLFA